jgi:hypothetical protein
VAVAVENGEPEVLLRQRPHLVETFSYTFRQPYHTAEKTLRETNDLSAAREFIASVETAARRLATQCIRAAQADLARLGYRVERCVILQAAGRPLPALEKILAAHALIHTADGELFREALAHAAKRCRLRTFPIRERGLLESASLTLKIPARHIPKRLAALGKALGPPWSQDEKFAALAAWLVLVGYAQPS